MPDGIKYVSAFVGNKGILKSANAIARRAFLFLSTVSCARVELGPELVAIQKIPVRQEGSLRSGIQASPLLAQTGRECLKIALPVISRLFPFAATRCFSLSLSLF